MPEEMHITTTATLTRSQRLQLFTLWNEFYPENLAYSAPELFDNYLSGLDKVNHWLLTDKEGRIEGWAWSFERERERWFAIILSEAQQGKGTGRQLLELLKQDVAELNGWVVDHNRYKRRDGKAYRTPLDFYLKCGFTPLPGQRLELEQLSAIKIRWSAP